MFQIVAVVLAICSLHLTQGYSTGPPLSACGDMFPHHGADAQMSAPPYVITVDNPSYTPTDDNITVTISTTNTDHPYFQGFFLQAHSADCMSSTVARGFFVGPLDSNTQSMTCSGPLSNNAVSHTSASRKTSVTVTWRNPNGGDVYFQATIVKSRDIFWANVQSNTVYDSSQNNTRMYSYCPARQAISVYPYGSTATNHGLERAVLFLAFTAQLLRHFNA
ncbi:putative defense protein [Haliotis rufescens]|uniref:putative defense protein n=1 Tax=Haliotis rufescens TaxID=6454 RepID=UPI001EAF99C0|nr:putative defense protein [Haliotis rufescens]